MTRGKTTADVCTDERCGHTRYNHDPSGRTGPVNRCRVDVNYALPPCPCRGFKEPLDEPDDFSGPLAAVQPKVDNIMAFARDDLGLMLYDWHADMIAELLGGSLGGGLCVRYRRGGKTTVAYVINEYLRRNAE